MGSCFDRALDDEVETAFERLMDRSVVDPSSDCIMWIGAPTHDGYSTVTINYCKAYGHRVVWRRFFGPVPDGMTVGHECGQKVCLEPAHLRLVSLSDSRRDGSHRRWREPDSVVATTRYAEAFRLAHYEPSPWGGPKSRLARE